VALSATAVGSAFSTGATCASGDHGIIPGRRDRALTCDEVLPDHGVGALARSGCVGGIGQDGVEDLQGDCAVVVERQLGAGCEDLVGAFAGDSGLDDVPAGWSAARGAARDG
jgi:hypothetical protein